MDARPDPPEWSSTEGGDWNPLSYEAELSPRGYLVRLAKCELLLIVATLGLLTLARDDGAGDVLARTVWVASGGIIDVVYNQYVFLAALFGYGPTLVLIELTTTLGRRQPILRLIGYGLAAWRYLIGWVPTIPMMT